MSTEPEPETIGPLTFAANPDYPYPFPVERPPRFWMEESSGALAAAMEVLIRVEPLSPAQLALIKIYLQQYLERAVLDGSADRRRLLSRIAGLRNVREVASFAEELAEVGVEPF